MAPRSWHKLTLHTVTPALLGWFATPTTRGESIPFPVPSLRGALGFWLRALAGARVGNDPDGNDLRRLLEIESKVFGAARTSTSGGPSTIALRAGRVSVTPFSPTNAGVTYLLGPREGQDGAVRRCLASDSRIGLEVKNYGTPAHADLFLAALWGLRTFGGIGARTRRGFGTVTLDPQGQIDLRCDAFDLSWLRRNDTSDLPKVLECVRAALSALDVRLPAQPDDSTQPSYPRFDLNGKWYRHADVEVPQPAGPRERGSTMSAPGALDWTGDLLRSFRHGGNPIQTTDGYLQVAKPYLDGGKPRAAFRAGALGLPVVYTEKDPPKGRQAGSATVEPIIDGQQPSRRASPLWLRVYKKTPLSWWLRSLAFDAVWLPQGARLQVKDNSRIKAPSNVTWPTTTEIRAELDRWFVALPGATTSPAAGDPAPSPGRSSSDH